MPNQNSTTQHMIVSMQEPIPLNDAFAVQQATSQDLRAILDIYNQSIAGKQATANLTPVTAAERAAWFDEHINSITRPIYVVRARATDIAAEQEQPIVAWGSYSDLYARSAYHISSEISIYLHHHYKGKGLGSALLAWMIEQAPSLGIKNIVALVFAHNKPSLALFAKFHFEQWGYMPQVCDMQGFTADVVMLGRAVLDDTV